MKADLILATSRPWHLAAFANRRRLLHGNWALCTDASDLAALVAKLKPRYVFFPHWSEIVPDEILSATECVCFHMTDLPFGRGGSPLQNLIAHGCKETMMTALRMTPEIDEGPIYAKRPLTLDGSALQIFERAAELTLDLITYIIETEPTPQPQVGNATMFKRRKPEQSRLPSDANAGLLYDHIRMLDAPGYPNAFLYHGPWRLTFTDAQLSSDGLCARVRFDRGESDGER